MNKYGEIITHWQDEHYFNTVACNSPQFRDKVLNSAMRFIEWSPDQMSPNNMTGDHLPQVRPEGNEGKKNTLRKLWLLVVKHLC
jgi:hypothetical protein